MIYPVRNIANGCYAIFEVEHTEESVSDFWKNIQTLTADLSIDVSKPIIERYAFSKIHHIYVNFCIPLKIKGGVSMEMHSWVLCPICKNKTRTKVREDTELINFPFVLSEVQNGNFNQYKAWKVTIIKEPDAKTQSR